MELRQTLLLCFAALSYATPPYPFETEPDLQPEFFDIAPFENHRSLLAPGHIFISPLLPKNALGPQIYDVDGNLMFHTGHRRVQDFKACDYLSEGKNYLCWHQSRFKPGDDPRVHKPPNSKRDEQEPPHPVGEKLVFDNTYTQVGKTYIGGIGHGKSKDWPNGHEYNMLPGGESFLQAVYRSTILDLRQYTGRQHGYINDGCFQEISVRSGECIFEWCYSDHLPLWETRLFFRSRKQYNETSPKAGRGTLKHPWDFIHLNAVDKTFEGDYLISGRHLDQIIKIAGPDNVHGREPGSLIWRLGGKSNDFEMIDDFSFSRQHDVRVISTTANETVFSLFNNAWEGTNEPSADRSSGMIIAVNNSTMQARVLHEYPHPDGSLARAMGSMQVLPNKNALVGWGASPQVTEYSGNGTVLWHVWYDRRLGTQAALHKGRLHHTSKITRPGHVEDSDQEWSYRIGKFPWVGKPFWSPKLLVYRQTCRPRDNSPLLAYLSWNGATEVRSWRLYISATAKGPWMPLTTVPKEGFETKVDLSDAVEQVEAGDRLLPWFKADALGDAGIVLGNVSRKLFVPAYSVRYRCNREGCRKFQAEFWYGQKSNCINRCESGWDGLLATMIVLVPLILLMETIDNLGQTFCRALAHPTIDRKDGSKWRYSPSLHARRLSENGGPGWLPLAHRTNRSDERETLEDPDYFENSIRL